MFKITIESIIIVAVHFAFDRLSANEYGALSVVASVFGRMQLAIGYLCHKWQSTACLHQFLSIVVRLRFNVHCFGFRYIRIDYCVSDVFHARAIIVNGKGKSNWEHWKETFPYLCWIMSWPNCSTFNASQWFIIQCEQLKRSISEPIVYQSNWNWI